MDKLYCFVGIPIRLNLKICHLKLVVTNLPIFSQKIKIINAILVLVLIPISFQIREPLNFLFPVRGVYQIIVTLVTVPLIIIASYKIITRYAHHVSEKTYSVLVITSFLGIMIFSMLVGFFGNESLQNESIYCVT